MNHKQKKNVCRAFFLGVLCLCILGCSKRDEGLGEEGVGSVNLPPSYGVFLAEGSRYSPLGACTYRQVYPTAGFTNYFRLEGAPRILPIGTYKFVHAYDRSRDSGALSLNQWVAPNVWALTWAAGRVDYSANREYTAGDAIKVTASVTIQREGVYAFVTGDISEQGVPAYCFATSQIELSRWKGLLGAESGNALGTDREIQSAKEEAAARERAQRTAQQVQNPQVPQAPPAAIPKQNPPAMPAQDRVGMGTVAICSSVNSFGNYILKPEVHRGESFLVYAEALNVNRGGQVDLIFNYSVSNPSGVQILRSQAPVTFTGPAPSAAWAIPFRMPTDAATGVYIARVDVRNNLTGQSGGMATRFNVTNGQPNASDASLRSAEKLSRDFFDAYLRGDLRSLVSMSDVPFYVDRRSVTEMLELEGKFREWISRERTRDMQRGLKIEAVRASSIREFKRMTDMGSPMCREQVISALGLGDEDIVSLCTDGSERAFLFFRKTGSSLKLRGLCD